MPSHNNNNAESVKQTLRCVIELVDDKLPVVGPLMDLPIVDELEEALVNRLVDAMLQVSADEEGDAMPWSA